MSGIRILSVFSSGCCRQVLRNKFTLGELFSKYTYPGKIITQSTDISWILVIIFMIVVQWGPEIQTSADFQCSKEIGWQMVQIFDGIWNPEAQPIWNWEKWLPFCQNNLKSNKNVQISNGPDFKWLGL